MVRRDNNFRITKFKGKAIAVAVGALFSMGSGSALAQAQLTQSATGVFGTAAGTTGANAGDNVNVVTFGLTLTDASNTSIGAITGSTGSVTLTTGTTGTAVPRTVGSIVFTGAGTVSVTNTDNAGAFANALTLTGNLTTVNGAVRAKTISSNCSSVVGMTN